MMQTTESTTACPLAQELRDYVSGRLDDELVDQLEQHVLGCAACEQATTAIENEPDTFVELLHGTEPDCLADEARQAHSQLSPNGQQSEAPPAIDAVPSGGPVQTRANSQDVASSVLAASALRRAPTEIGAYELIDELGSGGMGSVYLARHRKLDKQVAIKLLPTLPAKMPEFVARFEREMRAAGKLEHPAIVRTTDAGEHEGVHFLVMEAIDGLDLSRIARVVSELNIADACEVARQAALGLAHAHENGIVHRDIKPSNLMLDADGTVRILDFGLAQVGLWDSRAAEITTVGQLMGTLDYMAPEQAERGGAVDYRADLYALGATLFRLLSGRAPLAAAPDMTPLEKLRLLSTHRAPKLLTLRSDAPTELSKLLEGMLARDPAARPASASHAAELLQPFCQSAKLPELLENARRQAAQDPESQSQPSQLAARPVLLRSGNGTRSGWLTRWGVGLAMLSLFGLIAASIWFVIETGKGQLVVESIDADVTIKLRKDSVVADELRIEPGTTTTRLANGEYEIVIDSPSDNFTVKGQTFSIRRGETVVARITSKRASAGNRLAAGEVDSAPMRPSGVMEVADGEPLPIAVDKRLDETVYNGETLDTWLRKLKYERSADEIKLALEAIAALSSPEFADLITPTLIEYVSGPVTSWSRLALALEALHKALGKDTKQHLAEVLANASDGSRRETFEAAIVALAPETAEHVDAYSDWLMQGLLQEGDKENRTFRTVGILMLLTIKPNRYSILQRPRSDAVVPAWIAALKRAEKQHPNLVARTNEQIWFSHPDGRNDHWPEAIRRETLRRAVRLMNDQSADDQLRCYALMTVLSCAGLGFELPQEQRAPLVAALSKTLRRWSNDPNQAGGIWDKSNFQSWAGSMYQTDSPANSNTATVGLTSLNLVKIWELEGELQAELQRLHAQCEQMPIGPVERTPWHGVARSLFELSGELLNVPNYRIEARLSEVRDADRKQLAQQAVGFLEGSRSDYERQGISIAEQYLSPQEGPTVLPALTASISTMHDFPDYEAYLGGTLQLLSRFAGERFLEYYARSLEASPDPKLQLDIDFANLPEFGVEQVELVEPLLNWCDRVFLGDVSEQPAANGLREATASMLRSLLRDRQPLLNYESSQPKDPVKRASGKVSAACQQAIVARLESYSFLTDESFWLSEPVQVQRTGWTPMDRPFRLAALRHAVNALETESNVTRRCEILIVMRSCLAVDNQQPPSGLKEAIRKMCTQLLNAAATDLENACNLEVLRGDWTGWCAPHVQGFELQRPRNQSTLQVDYSNEALLVLEIARLAGISESMSVPLEALHRSAYSQEYISVLQLTPKASWQEMASGMYKQGLVMEAILLITGEMLGKDMDALINLPNERSQARKEQKRQQELKRGRTAEPGDTLAIYIEGILPSPGQPLPVMQAGTEDPVIGYPVPVNSLGEIVVPQIEPIQVAGKELAEVRELLKQACSREYVQVPTISVDMLAKSGEGQELRSLSSPQIATTPSTGQ